MPVLITGASGFVGRSVAQRLRRDNGEVRCYVRDPAPELVSSGCRIAIGDCLDIGILAGAMTGVHTLIHLAGSMGADMWESVALAADIAAKAAAEARVSRIIFVSCAGADASSEDPYLNAKGTAENLLLASQCEVVVLRTSFIYGSESTAMKALGAQAGEVPPELAAGEVNPIYLEDVSAAVEKLDDLEEASEVFELGGPDVLTVGELASAARELIENPLPGKLDPGVLSVLGAGVLKGDGAERLGLGLTSLTDGLAEIVLAAK